MSRRDDRDRSRTRRRRDRSTSPQARKAHRREHNDYHVSEGMDWNNLVSWQHNSGYNSANNFPMMPTNFQSTHSPTQQFQHPAINYMMPIPPDPTPTKFVPPVIPPPLTTPQPTPPPGPPAALPVRPQKTWLTPSPDWTPGDGMFDVNQLYNFSLPMTVANTPHGNLRDMSGMDIRDVRLVQVIHGGPSPTMASQKDDAELVTPPPVNHTQSSSPASSLPTASAAALDGKSFDGAAQPRIIQSLHGVSSPPSKPAASQLLTMHSTPEEVVKYYTWTSDQPRLYLKQSPTTTTLTSLVKWANHPSRLNGNKSLDSMATQLLQARQRMPKGDAPTLGAMAASWGLEPGYLTKLTEKALSHLIVTARLLS